MSFLLNQRQVFLVLFFPGLSEKVWFCSTAGGLDQEDGDITLIKPPSEFLDYLWVFLNCVDPGVLHLWVTKSTCWFWPVA